MSHAARSIELLESRTLFATVTVQPTTYFQTLEGAGGNFAQGRYTGTSYIDDSVGTYNLAHLNVRYARVGIPLRSWEPTNDDANANPATISFAGFNTTDTNTKNVFLLMQQLSQAGIPIIASVWDVPDWMVSNPTATQGRLVNSYSELAESIGSFLKYAKTNYGVNVKYVSLNEPDAGFRLSFTPAGQADFIWNAAPKFAQSGWGSLTTKFMAGETSWPNLSYIQSLETEITSRNIWQYVGAISFHAWGGLDDDYNTWNGIYTVAHNHGKSVYVNEMGWDATDYTSQQTWADAMNYAVIYHHAYAYANANATFEWQYQNDYPLIDGSGNPYKTFYVVKQMTDDLAPGAQRIKALSDDEGNVLAVGYKLASTSYKFDLINKSASAQSTTLTGLPNGTYSLVRTSSSQNMATVTSYTVSNHTLTLSLPASTLSTLKTTNGSTAAVQQSVSTIGTGSKTSVLAAQSAPLVFSQTPLELSHATAALLTSDTGGSSVYN